MKVKNQFLECGHFKFYSGTKIRFWEDTSIRDKSFKLVYPNLYHIARKRTVTVAKVPSTTPLKVSYRRAIVEKNLKV